MNAVWEHSPQKEGSLLILLALADFAHDDGCGAFPSVSTLAKKARMSERNTRYCLRKLELAGEIVREGTHDSGTTVYRVILPVDKGANIAGAKLAGGQLATAGGANGAGEGGNWRQEPPANIAPKSLRLEPSVEPSREPSGGASAPDPPKKTRRSQVDPKFDPGLEEWGKIAKELAYSEDKMNYETDKFIDHFLGTGDVKADWVAAWRNWLRRSHEGFRRAGR